MGEISKSLSMGILHKYKNSTFVESGTYKGGGILAALDAGFTNIISVEVDPVLYDACKQKFSLYSNVSIFNGDTAQILYNIIQGIDEPITFWLDGHVNYEGSMGVHPVPLFDELNQISKHHLNTHTILIDDRRLMGKVAENWVGHYWEDITENRIYEALRKINPKYEIIYEPTPHGTEDIIVARPK